MEELQVKRTARISVAFLCCYRVVLDKKTGRILQPIIIRLKSRNGKDLVNYSVHFPDKAVFVSKPLSFLVSNVD